MKTQAKLVELAVRLAAVGHDAQLDKAGDPYILHPLRVALCGLKSLNADHIIAAILHDTIEDTIITLDYLRDQGFEAVHLDAIDALTRRSDEVYMDYVKRCCENRIAARVKLADLNDNLGRLDRTLGGGFITSEEAERLKKRYTEAREYVQECIRKWGN
jgi:(p)ppGpp synthase/HD superfamily hydrolase